MSEATLQLANHAFGDRTSESLQPNRTLGWILYSTGQLEAAVRQFELIVPLATALLGETHLFTVSDTTALAASYRATMRREDARRLLERVRMRIERNLRNERNAQRLTLK